MVMPSKLSNREQGEICRLYMEGLPIRAIGKEFNCSPNLTRYTLRRCGVYVEAGGVPRRVDPTPRQIKARAAKIRKSWADGRQVYCEMQSTDDQVSVAEERSRLYQTWLLDNYNWRLEDVI